jgi:hypothetical protein
MVASRKEPTAEAAASPPTSSNSQPTGTGRPMVARPYSQLKLTIEPNCFILQPHSSTTADTGHTENNAPVDLLRILYRTADSTKKATTESGAEKAAEAEVKRQLEKEPIDLSTIAQEHPRRVSFISPGTILPDFFCAWTVDTRVFGRIWTTG